MNPRDLLSRIKAWLNPTPPPPGLVWKVQYISHQPHIDGSSNIIHFAMCEFGFFEIYEGTGQPLLLSFPRRMKLPAEIFDSLTDAKAAAIAPLSQEAPR